MNDIDIAIVIVSYKSAQLAIECLASIDAERQAAQSPAIRVVLVDNASGDLRHIAGAVEQNGWYSWVTLVEAPRNGGFAYGNNLGIASAYAQRRPTYIHLLNPDTQVRSGAITALAEFLETHPQVGIAGSSFETEDGKDWPYAFRFPTLLSEIDQGIQVGLITRMLSRWTVAQPMKPIAQVTDWISGASMMIRPGVFESIGCLDENFFLYFEETEFCHRARRAGFATWYVPQSRVMHMIGKSTNVNEKTRISRRLPGYWFDSRMRYYASTRSMGRAALIDVGTILSNLLGLAKCTLLRRPSTPHYIRDLLAHSALLRKNRRIAPLKSYFPAT
jgi:N-acetylglucosaminyl-diphospho-decaprenol L-rhamnosyltransferase